MKLLGLVLFSAALLALGSAAADSRSPGETQGPGALNESGRVIFRGRPSPYLIRRLPVSSFPDLPDGIQAELSRRGCLIPQTYEAHRPENVVHASLERTGSSDWAVLCSADGTVSLLVFFGDGLGGGTGVDADKPFTLASAPETERLQPSETAGVLGFNWGIDGATPEQVREAQAALDPRPPSIAHDALADSTVDRRTIYHFYAKNAWTLLDMPD